MKYLKKDAITKHISKEITVLEYCPQDGKRLVLDAAVSYINGSFGPKINTDFSELFYVLDGTLIVVIDNEKIEFGKEDVCIIPPGKKHTICGNNTKVFITCSPAFDYTKIIFD